MIKDHKSFLKVHPNTFRGQAAIEWLRGHAARALFGSEAEKEKNQQLSRSVALLLGQKLLAVGVFRQVTGSLTKPLEDPNALFRFHEDEKEGPLLNCRSIWFQNAREPLLVVSELLYTMLNLRLSLSNRPGYDLKDSEELNNFTAAAAELQLVNINDLSRIQLLAFFLNAYNLMVLHAHVVRGSVDNTDFKSQKIPFTRDNQYMIAAYNYSLAEIEVFRSIIRGLSANGLVRNVCFVEFSAQSFRRNRTRAGHLSLVYILRYLWGVHPPPEFAFTSLRHWMKTCSR